MVSHRRDRGRRTTVLRTTRRAEEGSALLIALVFVLVFSVLLAALLGFTQSNARSGKRLIDQRRKNYAADAAMESAINWAKDTVNVGRDTTTGLVDQACTYKVPADPATNTPAITVSCASASENSGRTSSNGTYPAQAILTLGKRHDLSQSNANVNYAVCGTSPEDGIRTKQKCIPNGSAQDISYSNIGPASIRGNVKSGSSIRVDGVPLELFPLQDGTGSTAAATANVCTGNVRTHNASGNGTLTNTCLASNAAPGDPGYGHRPINTTAGTVPGSCAASGVTVMNPGTFTSATALSNLFASASCKDKWIWFTPGTYYFNFADGNQSIRCGSPASSQYMATPEANKHEWCIGREGAQANNVHIVGGAPNKQTWTDTTQPPASGKEFPQNIDGDNVFGGNCDPDQPGVQFIFGGDSRMYVADGTVELCAGTEAGNPADPRIAIYGIREQKFNPPTATTTGAACPASNPPSDCIRNLNNSLAIDGNFTDIRYKYDCSFICLDEKFVSEPITLDFNGYNAPAGNVIESVLLRVAYKTHANSTLCTQYDFLNDVVNFFNISDSVCSRPQYTITGDGISTSSSKCVNAKELPYTVGDRLGTYATEIKDCFTGGAGALTDFKVSWYARATNYCTFFGCSQYEDQLDGIEVIVKLRSTSPSAEHPADGCITDIPNYNDGLGEYDCAVLKSDQIKANPVAIQPSDYVGRTSIKGLVYAPSAAVDFNDNFAKYPLFQRGLVARHLKLGAYQYIGSRVNTSACATGVLCEPTAHIADISPRPFVFPRDVNFKACIEAGTANGICDGTDKVLGESHVIYHVTTNGATPVANKPEVLSWANYR